MYIVLFVLLEAYECKVLKITDRTFFKKKKKKKKRRRRRKRRRKKKKKIK
jgi:hypothetical protein